MKYILVLILTTSTYLSKCQTTIDPELDKFVGTWSWVSGTDTVLIVLEKQVLNNPLTNTSSEILTGWHKYVKNGITIENSHQYIGRNINLDFDSTFTDLRITMQGITRGARKILFHRFWDITLHKRCNVNFELLTNSLTQAKWQLTNPPSTKYTGPPGTYDLFTLPRALTFTKL